MYSYACCWHTLTPDESQHHQPLSPISILLCSGGSKMLASLATYPHEVLRTRLQMLPRSKSAGAPLKSPYTGLFHTIGVIFRAEGLRGFYIGMGVNLIRTVPASGLTILTCVYGRETY